MNLFDYGNVFPSYLQFAKIKAYNSTKGTSNLSIVYDNKKWFKKNRFMFESTYTNDINLNFYGFNGINSNYNFDLIDPKNEIYKNPFYYTHQLTFIRIKLDFFTQIKSKKLNLLIGISYNSYSISPTDLSQFEIPIGESTMNYTSTSLYEEYIDNGIIKSDEKNGGDFAILKFGFIYDSRNNLLNCSKGICLETYILTSPFVFDSKGFSKHIITFRHYLSLKKIKSIFMYRLSSQQKIGGTIPFYVLPTYYDNQINVDGLGGAFNLRGINRNRIVGNGFLSGNFELRKNIINFSAFKQNCKIELSLFSDLSYLTQKYEINLDNTPPNEQMHLFNTYLQKLTSTFGAGLYFIYNTNNVISINYGISPDKKLGNTGLYIGSSFIF